MQRYYELVELARICSRQAQTTKTEQVARTLRRLARQYLQEAAERDGGNVPDIDLVCLKEVQQRCANRRERTPMAGFVYRCPNTGLQVQGWVADASAERDDESYKDVTCLVCARIHLVTPKTGKVLGEDGDE